jgi:phytoene desaturase
MSKRVIIAGAGFSGMSLAANLANLGFEVEIYEKSESPGGKVRQYLNDGFTFDMGASIYFYPEIFDRFFNKFNHSASDFYSLKKLDPSYRIFFNSENYFDIPAESDKLLELCDKLEPDGGKKMAQYLVLAEKCHSRFQNETLKDGSLTLKKHYRYSWFNIVLNSKKHQSYVRRLFKSYQIISLLEFPLPFFGIIPAHSPIFTFTSNYSLLKHGIFYPIGGMNQVEEALSTILEELKVPVHLSSEIEHFDIIGDSISGILTHQKNFHADLFASAMDYFHTEQLIGKDYRNYNNALWKSKPKYPSVLIFYLGFKKKLHNLLHHNLIFNDCFDLPPKKAIKLKSKYKTCLSFITCTSKTDIKKAPKGMENLVARISVPPGLEDTGKMREHYFTMLLNRLEEITGQTLKTEIAIKKSFAMKDFENDYFSFKGQAFGALNSVKSSVLWTPKIRNKHLSNLYYAELPNALGPGMASALLTGEMIANTIIEDLNRSSN